MTSVRTTALAQKGTFMTSRKIAALCAFTISGCSVFMTGVDPRWDGKTEPKCTDSLAPLVGDHVLATAIGAYTTHQVGTAEDREALDHAMDVALGGSVIMLVLGISALYGFSQYADCKAAKAAWSINAAINDTSASPSASEPSMTQNTDHPDISVPLTGPWDLGQHGFYCADAGTDRNLALCSRDRDTCEHALHVIPSAPHGSCKHVTSAWCHRAADTVTCLASRDACEARARTKAGATSCVETK